MKEIQLLAVKLVQFFPNLIQIEMTSIAEKKPLYFKANDGSKTLLLPDLAFILIVPDGPGVSPKKISEYLNSLALRACYIAVKDREKIKLISKSTMMELSPNDLRPEHIINAVNQPTSKGTSTNIKSRSTADIDFLNSFTNSPQKRNLGLAAEALDSFMHNLSGNKAIEELDWKSLSNSIIQLISQESFTNTNDASNLLRILARTVVFMGEEQRLTVLKFLIERALTSGEPAETREAYSRLANSVSSRIDPSKVRNIIKATFNKDAKLDRIPPSLIDLINRIR